MGKVMAYLIDGAVNNLLYYDDDAPNTADLIATGDRAIFIGDEYRDGEFYRNGEKILTKDEQIAKAINDADAELAALIDEIYFEDLEVINDYV